MASSYPAALDALSTAHVDGVQEFIHAATVNDLADAVNKIEAELGTLPKGAAADVKARIAATETVANAALPTPGGTNGQFLKRVGGVWVPTTFLASDIPSYPTDGTKALFGDGTWKVPTAGAMVQICNLTLSAPQASFDTNTILGGNIPQTYNHLKVVAHLRDDGATSNASAPIVRFNNDSAANYDVHYSNWLGANAPTESGGAGVTSLNQLMEVFGGSTANRFGVGHFEILSYAGANHKATYGTSFADYSTALGQLYTMPSSGLWKSTAAVTRISIAPVNGSNFVTGSQFTLYGIT